jgi:uncharacterized protein with von Willebrand factor type A (vWA) domain
MTGRPIPPLERWRLVLGKPAAASLGPCQGEDTAAMDDALDWLYGREPGLAERDVDSGRSLEGGDAPSQLSVPDWINDVHRLFPKETIERLERDAVERYRIDEVVTNPAALRRVSASVPLLSAVLRTKHLMNPEVLAMARELIARVVRELMDQLATELRRTVSGTMDRRRRSPLRIARNLDFRKTLHENLRHWDPARRRLYLERPVFYSRTRRHNERWQLILLVDQSGSMADSVIHAAVTAACLHGLPSIKTHLVTFDTAVVDVTSEVDDPVELLMKVQLGGGTDIQKAVAYAQGLITDPRKALVVVISDFYEGASEELLVSRVRALVGQGTQVLGLAALDQQADPQYDRALAARLVKAGAEVGAMTPLQLATWVGERVRR